MEHDDLSKLLLFTRHPTLAMRRAETWASAFSDVIDRSEARVMLPTVVLGHFAVFEPDGPLVSSTPVPRVEFMSPDALFKTCLKYLSSRNRVLLFTPEWPAWDFRLVTSLPPRTTPIAAGISVGASPPVMGVLHRSFVLKAALAACTLDAPIVYNLPPVGTLSVISNESFTSFVNLRCRCLEASPDDWRCAKLEPPLTVLERRVPLWKSWVALLLYVIIITGLTCLVYLTSAARDTYSFLVCLELAVAATPILLSLLSLPYSIFEASLIPGILSKFLSIVSTPGHLQRLLSMDRNEVRRTDKYEKLSSEFGLTHENDMSLLAGISSRLPQSMFETFGGRARSLPTSGFQISDSTMATLVICKNGSGLVSPLTGMSYRLYQGNESGTQESGRGTILMEFDFDLPMPEGISAAGQFLPNTEVSFKVQRSGQHLFLPLTGTVNFAAFSTPWEHSFANQEPMNWIERFVPMMNRKLDRVEISQFICPSCHSASWIQEATLCLALARQELGTKRDECCCRGTRNCPVSADLERFLKKKEFVFEIRTIIPSSFRSTSSQITTEKILQDLQKHTQINPLTGQLGLRDPSFFITMQRMLASVRALRAGNTMAYAESLNKDGVELLAPTLGDGSCSNEKLPELGGVDDNAVGGMLRATTKEENLFSNWSTGIFFLFALLTMATAVLAVKSAVDAGETWYERLTAVFFWPAFGLMLTSTTFRLLLSLRIGRGWLPTPENSVMRKQAELDHMSEIERTSMLVTTEPGAFYFKSGAFYFKSGSASYALPAGARSGELKIPPVNESVVRQAGLATTIEGTVVNLWGLFEAHLIDNNQRLEWCAGTRKASLTELKQFKFGPLL